MGYGCGVNGPFLVDIGGGYGGAGEEPLGSLWGRYGVGMVVYGYKKVIHRGKT